MSITFCLTDLTATIMVWLFKAKEEQFLKPVVQKVSSAGHLWSTSVNQMVCGSELPNIPAMPSTNTTQHCFVAIWQTAF